MHTTKSLIYTCTCIAGLAAGHTAGASIPDPGAAAATVAAGGPQCERVHDLLARQGLPSVRSLARAITREIVNGDGSVPNMVLLRPNRIERVSAAREMRPLTGEPDRAPAGTRAGDRPSGVLSPIRRAGPGFTRFVPGSSRAGTGQGWGSRPPGRP